MSAHAFTSVVIDEKSNTLKVQGFSNDGPPAGATLHVAVNAADPDDDRRCEATSDDIPQGDWTVSGPWTPDVPFSDGDAVVAVGRISSNEAGQLSPQPDHLWGNPFTIGSKSTS